MKNLTSVSASTSFKFLYQNSRPSGAPESNDEITPVEKKSDNLNERNERSERRKQMSYNRNVKEAVYNRIVSEEMDLPDDDFDKIKNIQRGDLQSLANFYSAANRKDMDRDRAQWERISNKIGSSDVNDLAWWLTTENGQEFLNGSKKDTFYDLSDYLEKKTKEDFDLGKEGLERKNKIISEEMDLPASDFSRISKISKDRIKDIFNSNSEEAAIWESRSLLSQKYGKEFGAIGPVDINDFGTWLKTMNGNEFLNGDYEDLSDYLKKRVGGTK